LPPLPLDSPGNEPGSVSGHGLLATKVLESAHLVGFQGNGVEDVDTSGVNTGHVAKG